MKYLLFALASIVASVAIAGSSELKWSSYSPELKLKSVDSKLNVVKFSGEITVSGELVFTFEGDGNTGDLMWAHLIPDPTDVDRLPQVTDGFYAAPLKYIWVASPDRVLRMAFGQSKAAYYSKGASRYVSRRVTARLRDYTSTIECDHRGYVATIVRIEDEPRVAQVSDTHADSHGC